jgi:GNAT superfamily N-acetyltransferase
METIKAGPEHLKEILNLVEVCTRHMNIEGSEQWKKGVYPTDEMLTSDIEKGNLHILLDDDNLIIAIVVVDETGDQEYDALEWKYTEGTIGYMHRMCIHPDLQGTGLAAKMWEFAEDLARQRGYTHMRLDTYLGNKQVQGMIQRRGYERVGTVSFPPWDLPYICYEKVL